MITGTYAGTTEAQSLGRMTGAIGLNSTGIQETGSSKAEQWCLGCSVLPYRLGLPRHDGATGMPSEQCSPCWCGTRRSPAHQGSCCWRDWNAEACDSVPEKQASIDRRHGHIRHTTIASSKACGSDSCDKGYCPLMFSIPIEFGVYA